MRNFENSEKAEILKECFAFHDALLSSTKGWPPLSRLPLTEPTIIVFEKQSIFTRNKTADRNERKRKRENRNADSWNENKLWIKRVGDEMANAMSDKMTNACDRCHPWGGIVDYKVDHEWCVYKLDWCYLKCREINTWIEGIFFFMKNSFCEWCHFLKVIISFAIFPKKSRSRDLFGVMTRGEKMFKKFNDLNQNETFAELNSEKIFFQKKNNSDESFGEMSRFKKAVMKWINTESIRKRIKNKISIGQKK